MTDEKYIGMGLALSSSALIGVSFVLTKKGLMSTSAKYGSASDSYNYFRNYIWWAGMTLLGLGELANFAAYSFAPAVLVTPLGALSVIVGAILASLFLGEKITPTGKAGCALCLLGSVVIIIHAPEDEVISSVDQIFQLAMRPWFLLYSFAVLVFSLVMMFKVAPKYGKTNPLIYISICSLVGSMTVTACKGFGIALKLTFAGNNQLTHLSTYVFALTVVVCIVVQMNYFNKALEVFSTNIVTPIYYVFFTTATIVASITLFRGFTKTDTVDITSLICGFLIIFIGVFLLNSFMNR
ncbi:magnesium transporter [Dimargaris cristalligena]|uniref:Magnesium transporter n=1 Tax=Dimargaris cristalligena TaxID=215637 RepID=A0A4P9ZSX1_9FUNG|nr:magnesium transporter [Dimargaris cristalligena]|eukprot:RKP35921.1 magnesium transporter [Dimargaris cristalligena]